MKDFQSGKYHILIDLSITNIQSSSINEIERHDVRAGNNEGNGTLLMTIAQKRLFYFNAIPSATSITQIGTTGAWKIALPSSVTTTKAIFIPDKFTVIAFNGNNYSVKLTDVLFPVKIVNNSGAVICTIYEDGNIMWDSDSVYTAAAISTTGLVQYQIN